MPQINTGKTVPIGKPLPFNAGDILTAADLNQMMDSATLAPEAITAQTNFPTLTGNEHTIIFDPASGQLRKTQLKNTLLAGNDIETDKITGKSVDGNLLISSVGSASSITLQAATGSYGDISLGCTNFTLNAQNSGANNGTIDITSGTGGIDFASSGTGTIRFAQRALFNTTGAIRLPVGTTAQRPATPVAGDLRFNTTTTDTEFYNGTAWESSNPVSAFSLNANGYIKLANGFTLQWGTFLTDGSNWIPSPQIVALPTTFTTAIVYANVSVDGANSGGTEVAHIDWTTSGKTTTSQLGVYNNYIGTCKFFAIGY